MLEHLPVAIQEREQQLALQRADPELEKDQETRRAS